MNGRYNVAYEDIDHLAYPVLRHRIKPSFAAVTEKKTNDELIGELMKTVKSKKGLAK